MSMLNDVLGDIASPLLSALVDLDRVASEAVDAIGDGVTWAGGETEELAARLASVIPKLEALKAKLSS